MFHLLIILLSSKRSPLFEAFLFCFTINCLKSVPNNICGWISHNHQTPPGKNKSYSKILIKVLLKLFNQIVKNAPFKREDRDDLKSSQTHDTQTGVFQPREQRLLLLQPHWLNSDAGRAGISPAP